MHVSVLEAIGAPLLLRNKKMRDKANKSSSDEYVDHGSIVSIVYRGIGRGDSSKRDCLFEVRTRGVEQKRSVLVKVKSVSVV